MIRQLSSRARQCLPAALALCLFIPLAACGTASTNESASATSLAVTGGGEEIVVRGPQGGPFPSGRRSYRLENLGTDAVRWTAASSVPWLRFSDVRGTLRPGQDTTVAVNVDGDHAATLTAGEYVASIAFNELNGPATGTYVSFRLVVEAGPMDGELAFGSSEPLSFGGPKGGPFEPSQHTLVVRNDSAAAVQWTLDENSPWLELSPTSGSLGAGQELQVNVALDNGQAAGLGVGRSSTSVVLSSQGQMADATEVLLYRGTTIENGSWLMVEGEPFFPIAVWREPPTANWVDYFHGLGLNMFIGNGWVADETNDRMMLDNLAANGMVGILPYADYIVDHPALLMYHLPDEPDLHDTPPSEVQAMFDQWKQLDPDRLIVSNLTGQFYYDSNWGSSANEPVYHEYTAIPDVSMFDMYPVTGYNRPDLVYVPGAATGFMRSHYLNDSKPTWLWIESSDQNLSWTPPETPGPSPTQMRFEIWDAIIHGATGIGYFTISFDPWDWALLPPEIEQEMIRSNAQITDLTRILLSPPADLNVTITEASGQPLNWMVRQASDGAFWLFVDNADMHTPYRSASMQFDFDEAPVSIDVYGESRSVAPAGTGFQDDFDPLEIHIYEIRF